MSVSCRHQRPPEAFADLWDTLAQGRPWTGLVKNRRKNGDFYWVLASATPIWGNGEVTGYMSIRSKLPADQRKVGDWSPNGAMTKKYLALTNRQAEVEAEIVDLGRAIMESDEPASSLH